MYEIKALHRTIQIQEPTTKEWNEIGAPIKPRCTSPLVAAYKAGALAALKALDGSRGARNEALLLEGHEQWH